jgi:hypothetical protein
MKASEENVATASHLLRMFNRNRATANLAADASEGEVEMNWLRSLLKYWRRWNEVT